jgi:general secretion pathway protein H
LETAALFRRERLGAILTGRSRRVSIDGQLRSLIGDGGDVIPIPRDVVVNILGVDEEWSGRQAVVRFLPDGASSGTVLVLSREQAAYKIRVNWFTGGVPIEMRWPRREVWRLASGHYLMGLLVEDLRRVPWVC